MKQPHAPSFESLSRLTVPLVLLLGLGGCWGTDGPELANVYGKVTLDGQPLPNARIEFQPQGGTGTYSSAFTDEYGEYEVVYSRSRNGAMIGTHTVSISTNLMLRDRGDGEPGWAPERVPPQYNQETELAAEVTPDTNQIDFDLKSGGFPENQ